MKTQRPNESIDQRPVSDSDDNDKSQSSGSPSESSAYNEAENGKTPKLPPMLPKRKVIGRPGASAPAQVVDKPAEETVVAQTRVVPTRSATEVPRGASTAGVAASPDVPEQSSWKAWITVENAIWLTIFVIAIVSRFYDIGNRALHHDESLHSVYSRNLYTGIGYTHDPMMHGPLQFHFIAAMYWLFGANEASVRFASALCGLFVVMSPYFLRRQMGRLTALICAFLLLISPGILYFSRMAREDAIFSGMEMIMLVGLWRFISMRKPADFYIFCAGLSLMFTIKETAYLTVAVLGGFFLLLFALQAGWAILGAVIAGIAVLGVDNLVISSMIKSGALAKLPDIPNTNPDWGTIATFATGFLTHPHVWSSVLILVLFTAAIVVLFRMQRNRLQGEGTLSGRRTVALPARKVRPTSTVSTATSATSATYGSHEATTTVAASNGNGHETPEVLTSPVETNGAHDTAVAVRAGDYTDVKPLWNTNALKPKRGTIFAHYEVGSMPHLLGSFLARPSVLLIGLALFSAIFVIFYSVFFTDVPRGILSGMFASLGYWIAQQGVARGSQPWFFYFLLLPLYEPIAMFFSVAAGIFFSWRGIRWAMRKHRERVEEGTAGLAAFNTDRAVPFASFGGFFTLFLGWWLVGALGIYSWAGEKMPWLMMHMARPAIFLASIFIGALVLSLLKARQARLDAARLRGDYADDYAIGNGRSRNRLVVGARFALANTLGLSGGSSSGRLAYATPENTARFSSPARGSRSNAPAPSSSRRQTGKTAAPVAVARMQEPPWVNWNQPGSLFPIAAFLTLFVLLTLGWGLSMSQQDWVATHNNNSYASTWGVTWFFPLAMAALVVGFAFWLGVGRALKYLAVGLLSVMLLYQFRSALQLTYRNPDVATEMAVYVQTSPDVTRVINELDAFSKYTTGGHDVKVIYDSEVSWPMEWYLGDYPNKQFIGGGTPPDNTDAPVMFLGYNRLSDPKILANYVPQRYALRWWFPEEWYKGSGGYDGFLPNQYQRDDQGKIITDPVTQEQKQTSPLAQVGDALHTVGVTIAQPEYQATLWKYLMYREPPKPLGSTDFVLFLRKDIAQQWHNLAYKPIPSTDVP